MNETQKHVPDELLSSFEQHAKEVKETNSNEISNEAGGVSGAGETGETMSKSKMALDFILEETETEPIEIYLPAMKKNVIVTPILSDEDLLINTLRVSFDSFMKRLNEVLLKHIIIDDKPGIEFFGSYDNFVESILPNDRTLIIFALLKVSFDDFSEEQVACQKCGKEFIFESKSKNMEFRYHEPLKKNFDFYNYSFSQKFINGLLEIEFGFNPEAMRLILSEKEREENIKKNVSQEDSILSQLNSFIYFIKSVKIYKKGSKKPYQEFRILHPLSEDENNKELNELIEFIYGLPIKIKEQLFKEIDFEKLEKFAPLYFFHMACPFCGHENELIFSPETEFFRKALSFIG